MEHMNLTAGERNELMALRRSHSAAAASVRRARLILMLDEGESWSAIKRELGLRLAVHLDVGWALRCIALGRLVRAPPGPRAHA
jgi:hypothetical protein